MGSRARVKIGDTMQGTTDALQNLVTGMNVEGRDKNASTMFGFGEMSQQQLNAAYRSDWISRKCIDIPAYDATREWRGWQADKDAITEIEGVEKDFKIQSKVGKALQWGRLYGGALLVLGVDNGKSDEELDLDTVQPGQLKFVHPVTRWQITAGQLVDDIESPWFGQPAYYERTGSSGSARFHPSRVIRFLGNENPDPLSMGTGWGDSILQAVYDAVIGSGTVTNAIAQLVSEAKIDIIKIPELSEKMSNKDYEGRLTKRFALANTVKSIYSMLLLDKEEEWERTTTNFTALPDVLKTYLLIASGAVDIPATRFLGQSPAGLSATGDSDTRNYYDNVSTRQKVEVQPILEPLDRLIKIEALGQTSEAEDIWYNWNPLWQMTATEKADIAAKKATVMTADVNAALLSPLVLQKARENQLIEDATYPGLEGLIEEFGDDITEREPANTDAPNPDDPNAPINPDDPNATGNQDPNAKAGTADPATKTANVPSPAGKKAQKTAQGDERAVKSMAKRVRKRIADATPRSAYVRRDVLNGADIIKWAKAQGFTSTLKADEMHVTIAYSKQPFNWLDVGGEPWGQKEDGTLTVAAGGPRMMEAFNGGATVLVFSCSDLAYRHCRIVEAGGSTDHPVYNPHITITYTGGPKDMNKVKPYMGEIKLGPEIWETIQEDRNKDYEQR